MKINLENVHEFLGSKRTKLMCGALILLYVGSFLLSTFQSGNEAICGEVKVVLEHNIGIEQELISTGNMIDAKLLHKSLVNLIKRADYCDASMLKKLLKGKPK
jgi:hypothetical protein